MSKGKARFSLITVASAAIALCVSPQLSLCDSFFATGTTNDSLYEINLQPIYVRQVASSQIIGANGNAWDTNNQRLYYSDTNTGDLYFWDRQSGNHFSLGNVISAGGPSGLTIASGSFYEDAYYFFEDGTANLWAVMFDFSGTPQIDSVTLVDDVTPDATTWDFGDIAISTDGTLYGSAVRQADGLHHLFKYGLGDQVFETIRDDPSTTVFPHSQLSLNFAGDLFGANALNGDFFSINTLTGSFTSLGNLGVNPADLAGPAESSFIFLDNFESGDTSLWTFTTGGSL